MSEDHNSPSSTGADTGSAGRGVDRAEDDPIFQQEKPEAGARKSAVLVWQFFLVPLLIVLAALAVFLLFGAFAGSEDSPTELLDSVMTGGGNERQQASHQLSLAITEAYIEERREGADEPPFYADPAFEKKMVRGLEAAMDDRDEPMIQFFAGNLGKIQAASAIPSLLEILYPRDGEAYSDVARLKAAEGLMFFDTRVAESALARIAGDKADAEVRNVGLSGLARLGRPSMRADGVDESPVVMLALRRGLTDAHGGSRVNAAIGLALRGVDDPAVIDILRQSLSRDGLSQMGFQPAFQAQALRNACKAVGVLKATELRDPVERLTDMSVEGDDKVREFAREALSRLD